jgi:TonB family protein
MERRKEDTMQRWGLRLIASCLVASAILCPLVTHAAASDQDITALQAQYNEALQEIERLRQALAKTQEEIAQLQQRLGQTQEAPPAVTPSAPNTTSYRNAIATLTRQIDADPQQASAYAKRGTAYAHLGDYAPALDDLNRAIHLDPQAVTTYNQRGIVYYKLGRYPEAIQDFDHAIGRAPQLDEAYHNRGIVYKTLGDYPKAHADLRQAADLGLTHAAQALQGLRADVRHLQDRLHQAGFSPGPSDGVPGAQTVAALQAYQRRQGLPATGQLDPRTQQALGLHTANTSPADATSAVLARFVKRPVPPYPMQARQQGWEGKVTLRFEMLADGTIGAIDVVQSSGYTLLDTTAQQALKTWMHQPVVQDGHAVTQWATLDFDFKLDDGNRAAP